MTKLALDPGRAWPAINQIAVACLMDGQYPAAITFYKRVLEEQAKELGPDKPATLNTKHNLALALRANRLIH